MGESTKVILWGREDIICQGVEIFLRSHSNYDVRRIIGDNNYEALIKEIASDNAAVVIINLGRRPGDRQLPLQLMETCSCIKIIAIGIEDSSVDVYHRQKVLMTQVSDLFDLIG